jgi:hypothetical protein
MTLTLDDLKAFYTGEREDFDNASLWSMDKANTAQKNALYEVHRWMYRGTETWSQGTRRRRLYGLVSVMVKEQEDTGPHCPRYTALLMESLCILELENGSKHATTQQHGLLQKNAALGSKEVHYFNRVL